MSDPTARTDVDPFFAVIRGGEWNACIGRQGTAENYVDGYMEAALELASAVIGKRQLDKRDTLAMPILYNARHAVELALKFVIDRLVEAGILSEPHQKNHDIKSHWELIAGANFADVAMRGQVEALRIFVESLHRVDEDGQQLRYAETQDGEKTLQDIAICNLELIRGSLEDLQKILTTFRSRAVDVVEERRPGTFTAELSRLDLLELARMLPLRAEWRTDKFTHAKAKARERFHLSGSQFSKAADVIQTNREMGSLIGLEFALEYLTDADVHFIVAEWVKANPEGEPSEGGVDPFNIDGEAIMAHLAASAAADKAVLGTLSTEKIADMQAIYYLGSLRLISEEYAPRLESALKELKTGEDPRVMIHHIMTKTNLPHALARGLEILGRPRLAAELRELRSDFAG